MYELLLPIPKSWRQKVQRETVTKFPKCSCLLLWLPKPLYLNRHLMLYTEARQFYIKLESSCANDKSQVEPRDIGT